MSNPQQQLRDHLRNTCSGLSRQADHGNSRKSAIRLMCLECQGGSRKGVSECTVRTCFLWPYRGSGSVKRLEGTVPSVAEYLTKTDDTETEQ